MLALAFVALVLARWPGRRTGPCTGAASGCEPHHAVNRLVLAKSCALAGALVAGGYLGYALSWLGLTDAELAQQRMRARAARRRSPAWRSSPGRCSSSARVGSVRTTIALR